MLYMPNQLSAFAYPIADTNSSLKFRTN